MQFKKFDMFAGKVGFEFDGASNYETNQGAILSILIYIGIIIFGIYNGLEVVERKYPNISVTLESFEKPIYYKQLPLFLTFLTKRFENIDDIMSYIDISAQIVDLNILVEGNRAREFGIKKCLDMLDTINKDYGELYKFGVKVDLGYTLYCIDFGSNDFIRENIGSQNSVFAEVLISLCDKNRSPELVNKFGECKDYSTNKLFLEGFHFAIGYVESYLYLKNYKDYLSPKLEKRGFTLYPQNYKEINLMYTMNKFTTDQGWIIESREDKEYITISSYKEMNSVFSNFSTDFNKRL